MDWDKIKTALAWIGGVIVAVGLLLCCCGTPVTGVVMAIWRPAWLVQIFNDGDTVTIVNPSPDPKPEEDKKKEDGEKKDSPKPVTISVVIPPEIPSDTRLACTENLGACPGAQPLQESGVTYLCCWKGDEKTGIPAFYKVKGDVNEHTGGWRSGEIVPIWWVFNTPDKKP